MTEELIIAGFGGQGVMLLGQLLAYAGMMENKHVSWIPSYGPEMRGGTANCMVVVSTEEVGSPVVTEPTAALIMNLPSFTKYAPLVRAGGLVLYDSFQIKSTEDTGELPGRKAVAVPATAIADELGNSRVANMVLLGAYLALTPVVGRASVRAALEKILPPHRHHLLPLNEEALLRGAAAVAGV